MVKAIDVTVNMYMDQISLKNYRDLFFAVISVFLLNVMEGKELCFSICIIAYTVCSNAELFSSEAGQKQSFSFFLRKLVKKNKASRLKPKNLFNPLLVQTFCFIAFIE